MKTRSLVWIALTLAISCWTAQAAEAVTYLTEADFLNAVTNPTTVSFDQFSVGSPPATILQMGDVTVDWSTAYGGALIFGPGPFGFTTNFLSAGAIEPSNHVVISFPAGTKAAGMEFVSASQFPMTLTATYAGAAPETISVSSATVAFRGFSDPSGIQSITVSSPPEPFPSVPIMNIGDITYDPPLAGPTLEIPTLSGIGFLVLILSLLIAGFMTIRRPG